MAINLDKIIANSSSVDEVVKALSGESQSSQTAAQQFMQLAEAARGSMNPLQRVKEWVSPRSTAGTLATDADYKNYVIQAQENGETPMSRQEYLRMREEEQKQQKQQQQSKGTVRG